VAYATLANVGYERLVKLFRNGRNQAVRIPREFELPGKEAVIHKEGDKLVIEPVRPKESLAEMLDRWGKEGPVDEQWPEIEDAPPEPVAF
jgi:antitoxin VapB